MCTKRLLEAIKAGSLEAVKEEIEAVSSIKIKSFDWGNYREGSALSCAAYYNQTDIIKFLVEKAGVGCDYRDTSKGKTPLVWALQAGSSKAAETLVALGADMFAIYNSSPAYKYCQNSSLSSRLLKEFEELRKGKSNDDETAVDNISTEEEVAVKGEATEDAPESNEGKEEKPKNDGSWKAPNAEGQEIIHHYLVPETPYRISDMFNFKARVWRTVTKDLSSGSISNNVIMFDDVKDKTILYDAAEKLQDYFNIKVEKSAIDNPQLRGKEKKPAIKPLG